MSATIDDNKLQKHFIEQYHDAYEEAEELLRISEEKAVSLVASFDFLLGCDTKWDSFPICTFGTPIPNCTPQFYCDIYSKQD